jgi:DNA-directed RNA polymerase specialized sigma subunit
MDNNNSAIADINLKNIIEDMFLVLTKKEKEVIISRFSLNNQPKQTLEKIGQRFNVTRERIRQIENIALLKLKRHITNSQLRLINTEAKKILQKNGGIMKESDLITETLKNLHKTSPVDGSIIKLSLSIDNELAKNEKNNELEISWRFEEISIFNITTITKQVYKYLKKQDKPTRFANIYKHIQKLDLFHDKQPTSDLILSCLKIDKRIKETPEGWGLMEWRSINPKSIKDKSILILKQEKKPLHFIDIANKISSIGLNKKIVTIQAVHNELIRYEDFVLVGRGLYALKEWGYEPGTVADVITKLLKEKGPLSKKEIIKEVQKQRDVQIGTISLNLQKSSHFIRVGRAVYDYKK